MQNAIWGLFLLAFAYDYFTLYKETINDSNEPRSVKESKEEIKNKVLQKNQLNRINFLLDH
jgi:hypothetical protein